MSADAFRDGVATLLTTDATFQAALTALLGTTVNTAVLSNQPWQSIPADKWPCFVIEQGDGAATSITNGGADVDGLTIGNHRQGFASDLYAGLLWKQADRDAAANVRGQLPTLIAQLIMRNPQPGSVSLAYLAAWESDRGINHPAHVWNATLRGEYTIRRS